MEFFEFVTAIPSDRGIESSAMIPNDANFLGNQCKRYKNSISENQLHRIKDNYSIFAKIQTCHLTKKDFTNLS